MDLIMWIARRVVPIVVRIVATVFAIAWRLPWLLMHHGPRAARGLENLAAWPARVRRLTSDTVRCPRCGVVQSLLGRFRCPSCKGLQTTHAWSACTICGGRYVCGYIACTTPGCGEAIPNPGLGGSP